MVSTRLHVPREISTPMQKLIKTCYLIISNDSVGLCTPRCLRNFPYFQIYFRCYLL